MELPAGLSHLDKTPGATWAPRDFERLATWWNEPDQERIVWAAAARYIGAGATEQDVEEAWIDFYKSILQKACRSYKPGGPAFCVYLLNVCFKNHCVLQGDRIRRRASRETSFFVAGPGGEILELQLAEPDGADSPHVVAEQTEFLKAVQCALQMENLPSNQRKAFILRYARELSYEEIALELNAPVGSAKAWVHRATARVARYLKDRDWLS